MTFLLKLKNGQTVIMNDLPFDHCVALMDAIKTAKTKDSKITIEDSKTGSKFDTTWDEVYSVEFVIHS